MRVENPRVVAIELSARFATIGEDSMISAELILDFIDGTGRLPEWTPARSVSEQALPQ
jgi:hypothetical protein